MPRFQQYTADVSTGVPQGRAATPADFGAGAAAAGEDLGKTGRAVAERMLRERESQDALGAARDAAAVRERALAKLDELEQTGEPVTARFNEFLEGELQTMRGARATQRGLTMAEQSASNIRADLGHAARVSDARLVGVQAKSAAAEMIRANGNTLQKSPDLLPGIIAEQTDAIQAMHLKPELEKALLTDMNAQAARNAGRGWVRLNAERAKEMIDGRLGAYLDPDSKAALLAHADTVLRAQEAEARIAQAEARRQAADDRDQLMNDLLVRVHNGGQGDVEPLTAVELANIADKQNAIGEAQLQPAQVNLLFGLMEKRARGKIVTDRDTLLYVMDGFANNTITARDILGRAGKIGGSDLERWVQYAKEGDTALRQMRAGAVKSMDAMLGAPGGMIAWLPEVLDKKRQLVSQLRDREDEYRKAGKNPVDYYVSDDFRRDVRAMSEDSSEQVKELGDAVVDMAVGDVIEVPPGSGHFERYLGGDKQADSSWEPVLSQAGTSRADIIRRMRELIDKAGNGQPYSVLEIDELKRLGTDYAKLEGN